MIRVIVLSVLILYLFPAIGQDYRILRDSSYSMLQRGEFQKAKQIIVKGLIEMDSGSNEFGLLSNDLGLIYLEEGDYSSAAKNFSYFIRSHPDNGFAKGNMALVLIELAQYDSAQKLLLQGLSMVNNRHNNPEFLNMLNTLAITHIRRGNYREAERIYKTAMGPLINSVGPQSIDFANWLNNLALLYMEIGRYRDAEGHLERAGKVYRAKLGERSVAVGMVYNNLGKIYSILGDYDKATEWFNQARRCIRKSNREYSVLLNNLATSNYHQGKWKRADLQFTESIDFIKAQYGKNHPVLASALKAQAVLINSLNDSEKAINLVEEAILIEKSIYTEDHPRLSESKLLLIELLEESDLAIHSDSVYRELLKMTNTRNPQLRIRVFGLQAQIRTGQGNMVEALKIIDEALETSINFELEETINSLELQRNRVRILKQLNRLDEAVVASDSMMALSKRSIPSANPMWAKVFLQRAKLEVFRNNVKVANSYFIKGLDHLVDQIHNYFPFLVEEEKIRFFNSAKDEFDIYYSFALNNREKITEIPGKMMDYQMTVKSTILNATTVWKSSIRNSGDINLIKKFADWQLMNEQLVEWKHLDILEQQRRGISTTELENQVYDLEKDLLSKASRFATQKNNEYNYRDISNQLVEGEVAIDILRLRNYDFEAEEFTNSSSYIALVLHPGTVPEAIIIGDGKDFEERLIRQYRNSIKYKTEDKLSYIYFWKPLENTLNDKSIVYICLDGIYNQLSLNSLLEPVSGKFLIDIMEIHTYSNLRDILKVKKQNNNRFALLVGNPAFDLGLTSMDTESITRSEIMPLPGTAEEIENLQFLLEDFDWEVEVYTESSATETNLRDALKPGLLHIATHGYFNQRRTKAIPLNPYTQSGLMLTGASYSISSIGEELHADKPDGLLTAAEAMTLNVDNTDLVVLSACETGLGEIVNGDGVYGLQRSFLMAGANSLMMSLWKIDDKSTQKLMDHFYERWLNGEEKYMAFKNAQLELRKEYSDPYYWAAFTLIE